MSAQTWDGCRRLQPEMRPEDPRFALFDAACVALETRQPDDGKRVVVSHGCRTWWAARLTGRRRGVAVLMLFKSSKSTRPRYAAVVASRN